MPDTAFNNQDLNDMTATGKPWAEHTMWATLGDRLDAATKMQLMQIANSGIGEPEVN